MSKDEKTTSYIEEFNRSHRRIKREEKDWYVPYLPRGLGMEDITEKEDRELMSIFTQVEAEMEMRFDLLVRDRFKGYFESLSMTDILEYLPQKPNLIILEDLKTEDRNNIKEIYETGVASGYIKKTIRKQIRKYLQDNAYLKSGDHPEYDETEKSDRETAPKGKTHDEKVTIPDSGVDIYLPQKPISLSIDMLDESDRKVVLKIYREGIESGFITKTIRKHIRKYLDEKDILSRIKASSEDQDTVKVTSGAISSGKKKGKKEKKVPGKEKSSTKKEVVKKSGKKAAKSPAGKRAEPDKKVLEQIREFLPTKPEISMEGLETKHQLEIIQIYEKGIEAGFIKKTLRKQIRKYLGDNEYLVPQKSEKGSGVKKAGTKKGSDKKEAKKKQGTEEAESKIEAKKKKGSEKPESKKETKKKKGTGKAESKKETKKKKKGSEKSESKKETKKKKGTGKAESKKEAKKKKGTKKTDKKKQEKK